MLCVFGLFIFRSAVASQPFIEFAGVFSDNIYLDDPDADSTVVIYRANTDISEAHVVATCGVASKFLGKQKSLYFFEVDYSNIPDCKNGNIILFHNGEKIPTSLRKLELRNAISDMMYYTDISTSDIKERIQEFRKDMKKYGKYKKFDTHKFFLENIDAAIAQSKYNIAKNQSTILEYIVTGREMAYDIPVVWGAISENHSKIPNASRGYRSAYTDGIHRGWDIAGNLGQEVIALDDGVIVRVVSGFQASDFDAIRYDLPLSELQKLKNLDILRGNQVWIKTLKGEVVLYSHLQEIDPKIYRGAKVERGQVVGTIGTTGVPWANYTDYHLHFAIMENPYILEKAGKYTIEEYMAWDWKLKDISSPVEVIEQQRYIFR